MGFNKLACKLLDHRWDKWQRRPFPNQTTSFRKCIRCGEEKEL